MAGRKKRIPRDLRRRLPRLRLGSELAPETVSAIQVPALRRASPTPDGVLGMVEVDEDERVGEVGVTSKLRGIKLVGYPVSSDAGSGDDERVDSSDEPDSSRLCLGTDMENGPTSSCA